MSTDSVASRPAAVPRAGGRLRPAAAIERAATYGLLWAGAAVMLLPVIWMVAGSFRPQPEFFRFPERLLPVEPAARAYVEVWRQIPFARFFLNSVLFAGGVTLLSLLLDSLAAYAFARLRFRGRDLLFWVVLLLLMVPFQITLVPLFLTVFQLGWLDSYAGLIIPRATNAFGIFMLRQFFLSIPRDLDDAARVDGASEFRIYWQIILPLAKPALATLAVFHFMYNWNDFLWPLVITTSTEMRTLPAGLTLFMGAHVIEHALLLAGATITVLPLAIAFVLAQRHFVRGIATAGLK
jgi:multiple sugar transport system permease protein